MYKRTVRAWNIPYPRSRPSCPPIINEKPAPGELMSTTPLYDIPVNKINGETTSLAPYRGQVLLLVNVASQCGLTPQYDALEKLYSPLKDSGFVVCGFPSNPFGAQEPVSNEDIQTFCRTTFVLDFPLLSTTPLN